MIFFSTYICLQTRGRDKHQPVTSLNVLFLQTDQKQSSGQIPVNTDVDHMYLCLPVVYMFFTFANVSLQVRKNHVAPIYVINLLISDLIQLCCLIIWVAEEKKSITYNVGSLLYSVGLMVSICFMVCIALER